MGDSREENSFQNGRLGEKNSIRTGQNVCSDIIIKMKEDKCIKMAYFEDLQLLQKKLLHVVPTFLGDIDHLQHCPFI